MTKNKDRDRSRSLKAARPENELIDKGKKDIQFYQMELYEPEEMLVYNEKKNVVRRHWSREVDIGEVIGVKTLYT